MLHPTTFEYLPPTPGQMTAMATLRAHTAVYAGHLEAILPDGPDKTYILRKLRELAMWNNVALTREADGTPRT